MKGKKMLFYSYSLEAFTFIKSYFIAPWTSSYEFWKGCFLDTSSRNISEMLLGSFWGKENNAGKRSVQQTQSCHLSGLLLTKGWVTPTSNEKNHATKVKYYHKLPYKLNILSYLMVYEQIWATTNLWPKSRFKMHHSYHIIVLLVYHRIKKCQYIHFPVVGKNIQINCIQPRDVLKIADVRHMHLWHFFLPTKTYCFMLRNHLVFLHFFSYFFSLL